MARATRKKISPTYRLCLVWRLAHRLTRKRKVAVLRGDIHRVVLPQTDDSARVPPKKIKFPYIH